MKKQIKWHIYGIIFVLVSILISLNLGSSGMGLFKFTGQTAHILWRLRLPRIIFGFFVGAGLSIAGGVLQGILKNPLAEPYVLSTSSGAAFGVALLSFLNLSEFGPIAGFIFGLITTVIVYWIANYSFRDSPNTLILAGVIMGSFMSALTLLIMVLKKSSAYKILFFLSGNLSNAEVKQIPVVIITIFICFAVGLFFARDLNIMSLGEEQAHNLGVDVAKVRKIMVFICCIIVAVCVSAAGVIGFVGLVIPHIVRLILGADHRRLLPMSFLFGGGFLIICDGLARSVMAPIELPVGVITAFTGAPFFMYLLLRKI
ncbi:MAG: FecCD family ABC transporter permease [Elusimicrobiota bacterium]